MRRLRPVGARPQPHRAPVDAIGAQTRHAGMVGERADLLMAGLAGNAVAENEGMPRPGPPLPGLVGPAEQNDREGARRGRQVRRAGIRADEEVGPLEQSGRLGDRQAARPVAQPVVGLEDARQRSVFDSPDHHDPPATFKKSLDQDLPRVGRPALRRVAGTEVNGEEGRQAKRIDRRAASPARR